MQRRQTVPNTSGASCGTGNADQRQWKDARDDGRTADDVADHIDVVDGRHVT